MTATIIQPGQLESPVGDIPFLRLPEKNSFFKDRAARFDQLAQNHTLRDFLAFMARVAEAQHAALQHFPQVPLLPTERLALSREHGMAPLPAQNWPRDPAWRKALSDIVDAVCGHLPRQGQDRLARLGQRDADALEKLADAVIAGRVPESDWGAAVLIAAALQTYWIHMSTALGHDAFARTEPANLCPVCASAPVASLVRIGPQQGLRYLHCSLCAAEWHMVRAKCSNCESTRGIAYFTIAGGQEAVKAESCEECGSYLKILYMDKDPWLEPTADDLATLALDILMGERGAARSGPNLFLISE